MKKLWSEVQLVPMIQADNLSHRDQLFYRSMHVGYSADHGSSYGDYFLLYSSGHEEVITAVLILLIKKTSHDLLWGVFLETGIFYFMV